MPQFNRKYSLIVYGKDIRNEHVLGTTSSSLSTLTTEKTLDISELRIRFDVFKSKTMANNTCKLEVYNMSAGTRAKIRDEFQRVVLSVGYGDDVGVLFDGDISNIFHRRERADVITEIYLRDGFDYTSGSITNKSSGENKTVEQLLLELIKDLKDSSGKSIPLGEINIASGATKLKGIVFSSSTTSAITTLAESYDFDWFIIDGQFYALSEGLIFERQKLTTVSAKTGLLDTPTITEIGADAKTLLNRDISPGRRIKIESTGQNVQLGVLYFQDVGVTVGEGEYQVLSVTHTGDTRGNEWYSYFEGQRAGLTITQ